MNNSLGTVSRLATPLKAWVQRFALLFLVTLAVAITILARTGSPIVERSRAWRERLASLSVHGSDSLRVGGTELRAVVLADEKRPQFPCLSAYTNPEKPRKRVASSVFRMD